MRTFRVLALVVVAALFVAAPGAFASVSSSDDTVSAEVISSSPSKVCHPKKPVTCRATDLAVAIADVAPSAKDARLQSQEAMVCVGPRWACRANTLPTEIAVPSVNDARVQSQEAMVCVGPRWACRANTLPTDSLDLQSLTESRLESQEAMVCVGPRWACKANTLG